MEVTVRLATIADAPAITAVHCSTVTEWRHPTTRQPVPYATLDRFGCWYNGGPWMHVELCAWHLADLLACGHLPLVAEAAGQVVAEAEYILNYEPIPFGPGLHLSILYVHADWQCQGIGRRMLDAGIAYARAFRLGMLTTQPETEVLKFYRGAAFVPWHCGKEMQLPVGGSLPEGLLPVRTSTAIPAASLALRVGRYQCGEMGWETLWPARELPGWSDLRRRVWRGTLAGTPVVLGLREQLNDATQADGYAWLLPAAPLTPAVAALRALAGQEGYTAVDLLLPAESLPELRQTFPMDCQTTVDLWRLAIDNKSGEG
ncbi:MAG: GNAT family N-acetyltransferase [Anaerolineae bacterium]|nr:GNAT family N-acetyltransferase [Anaerolineae bacterium]